MRPYSRLLAQIFITFSIFNLLAQNQGAIWPDEKKIQRLHTFVRLRQLEIQSVLRSSLHASLSSLNLTNVRPADDPARSSPFLPASFEQTVLGMWDSDQKSTVYFHNVSSVLQGVYRAKGHLPIVPMNPPNGSVSLLQRNVSSGNKTRRPPDSSNNTKAPPDRGTLSLNLKQTALKRGHARALVAELTLSRQVSLVMQGVYLNEGHILLSTRSTKFSGDIAIPYIIPKYEHYPQLVNDTRYVMTRSLNHTLSRVLEEEDVDYYDAMRTGADSCEFVFYGRTRPLPLSQEEVDQIDKDHTDPQGRPTVHVPHVAISGVMYSPNCGVYYKMRAHGSLLEDYAAKSRLYFVILTFIALALAALTAHQMIINDTPTSVARGSFYTLVLMTLCDTLLVAAPVWFALLASSLVLSLIDYIAIASGLCLAAACLVFLEGRFMFNILTAQNEGLGLRYPQMLWQLALRCIPAFATRGQVSAEGASGTQPEGQIRSQLPPATEAGISPVGASELDGTEIITEARANALVWNTIFSAVFFLPILMLLLALLWPTVEQLLAFIMLSFWVPQIYRNVVKGYRRALVPSYIIGSTLLRLIPVSLFYFFRRWAVGLPNRRSLGWLLIGWQTCQMLVLLLQGELGPRFFVPGTFVKAIPVYDYHPIIGTDLEEALDIVSEPVTFDMHSEDGSESERSRVPSTTLLSPYDGSEPPIAFKSVDCAICMNSVRLVVSLNGHAPSYAQSFVARRKYMVTPCRHVFNTECLTEWMRTRLQCPVCRNPLPTT